MFLCKSLKGLVQQTLLWRYKKKEGVWKYKGCCGSKLKQGMGGKYWKVPFGKIAAARHERAWKHRGSALHMARLHNYICTEGFRGFGWLSSSTPSRPDHTSLFQGPQAGRTQLCWILRSLWYGASLKGCPQAHLLWIMSFLHQNISSSNEPLDTQMCRDSGGFSCWSGGGMLHISRKWKCYFRLSADMTLRAGAGLLFTESLKLEKTFKMEPNHFGLLYPTKLSITWRKWTLMEIATWTSWGCCRPGSCSSCLSDVSWLTWRCFPEQLREEEMKRASAQVRGGHAP